MQYEYKTAQETIELVSCVPVHRLDLLKEKADEGATIQKICRPYWTCMYTQDMDVDVIVHLASGQACSRWTDLPFLCNYHENHVVSAEKLDTFCGYTDVLGYNV